jgi:hypothetical protein
MRKVSVCFASAALAAVVFSPPAEAFGLRVGPFHIGLPYLGYRHHHPPLYMRAAPNEPARAENGQARAKLAPGMDLALLYPGVALSAIFQNIFWPANSSAWPFGYQDIFSTAFAKTAAGQDPGLCQQPDSSNAIVGRIQDQVAPTPDQMRLLQRLGGALSAAAGSLAKSCPNEIPAQPTARLQLMGSQVEQLTMAVDMIRQPLQDFGQSLNDEQKARFAVMIEAPAPATNQQRQSDTVARSCGASLVTVDWSIGQIDQSVQPTDEQLGALTEVRQALGKAASDLEAHCPTSVPPTALGRLENIQARLDSTWRAALAIQVALANFETKLSDEQKNRFDTMDFAAR